jgi:hypothetical protein
MKTQIPLFAASLGVLAGAIVLSLPTRAQTPGRGVQIKIGPNASSYVMQLAGTGQTEEIRIQMSPDVRRTMLRLNTLSPTKAAENRLMSVELFENTPSGGNQRIAAGQLIQVRDLERVPDVYRVLWLLPGLTVPRKEEVSWLLRFRSLPITQGREPLPVQVGIEIHSDATPLTDRERALIAWREGIKDPLKQVDLVRAKVAELTEEEVRLYTGFDSRALFLRYWEKSRRADLLDANGRIALEHRPGYRGLTSPGKPLPNGKYLHHNGTVPPLPD